MSTTSSSDLGIPDLQACFKQFERYISPDDSNEHLKACAGIIWQTVREALSEDKDRAKVFVTEEVYKANIQILGEEKFYGLLRDAATTKDWSALLKNGMFLGSIAVANQSVISCFQRYFLINHFRTQQNRDDTLQTP
jgi:hypothetical protein